MPAWPIGPRRDGKGYGIAYAKSFGTYVAEVVEVEDRGGTPRVTRVWCAVDCGIAVNPKMSDAAGTVQYRLNNGFTVVRDGNGPWKAEKSQERVAVLYGSQLIETRKAFTWTLYGQPLSEASYGCRATLRAAFCIGGKPP
ncbi:hypothetical protein DPM13_15705 [Paracoccus mutanolyticus]|uniref:Uncharacterized protein n=2 Tax=Paracoccus mutanolyticus TaxID=1499308 RepID=A0ABM6WTM5_9RHOB|nr:hypothetical protein DPM13_15705 [Paracoccus mutanolyticus]